jgi:hypothetical protein
MKKSNAIILLIIVVIIGISVPFFFFGGTAEYQTMVDVDVSGTTANPDVEGSGIEKVIPKEQWTVFNGHELSIETKTQFKYKSDLTIPAVYDGKEIYQFDITFDNEGKAVSTLKHVVIEKGIRSFSYSFTVCTGLETVVIPKTVTSIYKDEFERSRDTVTLYVKKGSYAEKYAKKHKLNYCYGKPENK